MTPKDPSDAFLTRAEMANALGKSKTTIRQWEESEVGVLCALVKDRSALVELDGLRSVVEELHAAIVGHGGDVIPAASRFTRP